MRGLLNRVHLFGANIIAGGPTGPVQLTIDYTATQFDFKWKAPATSTLVFHWGDGTMSEVAGNDSTLVTTTSSYSGAGSYDFWITGDVTDLTYIDIRTGGDTVSGSIDKWAELTNLTIIYANNRNLSGNFGLLATGCTGLTNVRLYNNVNVTGDVSLFYSHSLVDLQLHNTSITFDNTNSWSNNSASIFLYSSGMNTSQMVDNAISSLKTCTNCTINLAGTNAHRTAASNDDLNTLLANGNTITLNDTLGDELIVNAADREFSSDTGFWTKAAEWTIAAGVTTVNNGSEGSKNLSRAGLLTSANIYRFEFEIKRSAAGLLRIYASGSTAGPVSIVKVHVQYITADGAIVYYNADPWTDMDMDNMSIKQVTFT